MLSAALSQFCRQQSDRIIGARNQRTSSRLPPAMQPELQQKILDELKAEMAAHPRRRSKLAEYDSLIGAMRDEGAPWTTVQRYMAKAGVEISAESIRSYWHRHHRCRRRPVAVPAVNRKTQTKEWTFNAPSTLE
jgi:hypothetical protein